MTNLTWLLLPGILYLGILASYTDIRYGKIRNKAVLRAIIYALVVYALAIIFFAVKGTLSGRYVAELGTNILFAAAICFGLWVIRIWSAGDGKLFFAFALLIPPEAYQFGSYNWVPSLTLLFNAFLIGLFFMVYMLLGAAKWHNYRIAFSLFLKRFFEPKKFIEIIVSLFAVFWLSEILLRLVEMGGSIILRYAVTIIIFKVLPLLFSRLKTSKAKPQLALTAFTLALSVLRLAIDRTVYTYDFLKGFIILVFVWGMTTRMFRTLLHSLGKDLFTKWVPAKKLKPGHILSDKLSKTDKLDNKEKKEIMEEKGSLVKKGKEYYVLSDKMFGKGCISAESEGLTKEDIKFIRKIGFKNVRISSTMPFAPLLFLGVLATLLAKGNILIFLVNLF